MLFHVHVSAGPGDGNPKAGADGPHTTRITRDESFYNHHRTKITHATNYVYQLRSSSSYAPPTKRPQPHCLYGDTLNKADLVARGPADMSYILFMVGLTAAVQRIQVEAAGNTEQVETCRWCGWKVRMPQMPGHVRQCKYRLYLVGHIHCTNHRCVLTG